MAAGRPTKAEAMLYRMAFRDEISEVLKSGYVRLDDRYGIDVDSGVLSKLEAIGLAVSKAHSEAAASMSAEAFDDAMTHPWITSTDPVTYGRSLMHQHWICQRIIETLETHLVDQVLVQASIQRKLQTVRDHIAGRVDVVPETILDFARRLHQSGMKASPAIQNMSVEDVRTIADAFNAKDASGLASVFRPGRNPMTDGERAELVESARRIEDERAAGRPVDPCPSPVVTTVPPPPSRPPGTEWTDTANAAPPEFFDGIDDVGLPYRWQYRDATEAEAKVVLGLPMPPQDTWERLRVFDSNVAEAMDLRTFDIDEVEDFVRSYLGFRARMDSRQVPMNWVKAWILLLIARPTPKVIAGLLGDRLDSYFEGVMLPVISMGSGRIRELIRVAS
jgi:hypothetical protein